MKSLNRLAKMIGKWDTATFGNYPISKAKHMRKEIDELIEAIKNNDIDAIGYEAADIFILLSAIMYRLKLSLPYYTINKMKINKIRAWNKPDKDGIMEHIKNE